MSSADRKYQVTLESREPHDGCTIHEYGIQDVADTTEAVKEAMREAFQQMPGNAFRLLGVEELKSA